MIIYDLIHKDIHLPDVGFRLYGVFIGKSYLIVKGIRNENNLGTDNTNCTVTD